MEKNPNEYSDAIEEMYDELLKGIDIDAEFVSEMEEGKLVGSDHIKLFEAISAIDYGRYVNETDDQGNTIMVKKYLVSDFTQEVILRSVEAARKTVPEIDKRLSDSFLTLISTNDTDGKAWERAQRKVNEYKDALYAHLQGNNTTKISWTYAAGQIEEATPQQVRDLVNVLFINNKISRDEYSYIQRSMLSMDEYR